MVKLRKRLYDTLLTEHLATQRQMAFVSGPRQVGKTTTCRGLANEYLNWDNLDDRERVLSGPAGLVERLELNRLRESPPVALFDELHKYPRWKQLLKGLFDTYADQVRIIVTGSSRMDTYRRGGDSLMGRYFLYRMHPFSVGEAVRQDVPDPKKIISQPKKIASSDFEALWTHGGYPEPFTRRDIRFSRRWRGLRIQQLLREDIRDLTQIQQLGQLETMARLLGSRSSRQLVYSNLAGEVRVSVDTVRRWIDALCSLHLGFLLRPWFRNVSRSLRKEPKWFLRDWSAIDDTGERAETFIGCHLLKAVECWNDMGLGDFHLGYLRDKSRREVDFIVIRGGRPWFLVEAKHADGTISPFLKYFQEQTKAPLAFQVVIDAPYVEANCFAKHRTPMVVPARTLLSQLP